ncbi:hypothetical protein GCM10027598_54220 [Amycolatopsis oliviviridis]|uniref:Uncharacterized protein n=1 Tax=Amycolatopsis oliviviridis TaxID=1471590 RepID=A0ABQ3M6X8_9PSEU|nr:hypothetical protein [Amycolatopsis oliviviridis]GHH35373.1 hypothetical protein GCM10017790_76660 [Amycolatopsis oliviviridis]
MPDFSTIATGFALLLGGYLLALLVVHEAWGDATQPQITTSFNAFALLFVMALAIERLVQPFAPRLGPDSAGPAADLQTAQGREGVRTALVTLNDARNRTAIVTWGLATGLACLLAAGTNITLLQAITDRQGPQIAFWLDLLVTGLVVGAGTKPINDLWTRLQNKSPAAA